jgi:membrane protein DedA with SNARE-associated domain
VSGRSAEESVFAHGPERQPITSLISTYGAWLVAGMIALECIGVPVPGETILVAAAIYAATTHELNIWLVVAGGIAGAVLGNIVAFAIGRRYGYWLLRRYGSYLRIDESRMKIGQYLFLRYGSKVVFFARFIPVLRSVAALLAGANRMPWHGFMIANVAGAVAWVCIDSFGAYLFGEELTRLAAPVGIALALVVILLLLGGGIFIARHEQQLGAQAENALPGPLPQLRLRHRRH